MKRHSADTRHHAEPTPEACGWLSDTVLRACRIVDCPETLLYGSRIDEDPGSGIDHWPAPFHSF